MARRQDTPRTRSLTARFSWFALAGLSGFAVDAAVLAVLVNQGFDARVARLISFGCALVTTWLINRSFAFGDRAGPPSLTELLHYASASALAGFVNLGVFTLLAAPAGPLASMPVPAAAVATAIAMSVNFWSYLRIVFVPRTN